MKIAGLPANRVDLNSQNHYPIKVLHFPTWDYTNQSQRMDVLREIAMVGGRNPKLATFAVGIIKRANVKPRDYKGQAAALLKWVQKNIYYVNEPAERLQDPIYTLRVGYGDCDDMIILLMALLESINLKWRFVLVAKKPNGKYVRWVEGNPLPRDSSLKWAHIYGMVGDNPYSPKKWFFIEPTLSVPLGWDIVQAQGQRNLLPELGGVPEYAESGIVKLDEDGNIPVPPEPSIWDDVKDILHPKNLIPSVIAGAVSGVFIALLSEKFVAPALGIRYNPKKYRKRKKRK